MWLVPCGVFRLLANVSFGQYFEVRDEGRQKSVCGYYLDRGWWLFYIPLDEWDRLPEPAARVERRHDMSPTLTRSEDPTS